MEKILFIFSAALLIAASPVHAQNAGARFIKSGMEQIKAGDYRAARETFELAVRDNESSFAAHLRLGIAYFHLREDTYAERELARAAELNPKEAAPYQLLGELHYRKDDLETAASYWEKAVELDPSATAVRARLDRIRREHRTEKITK